MNPDSNTTGTIASFHLEPKIHPKKDVIRETDAKKNTFFLFI